MARKSVASITVNPNLRCQRVYPTENYNHPISALKTVGLKLSSDQAIELARALLAASQDWDEVEITAYRLTPRKIDRTYHITITSRSE